MLTFIEINGFVVIASQRSLASWIIRLSDDLDPEGLAKLIRPSLQPEEVQIQPD